MRLVIAISAVATLLTACSFFDAEGPVRTTRAPTQIEQATPATEDTSHISDVPSPTPRLDPDSQAGQPPLNSTPKGPPQLTEADQTLAEKRRWCKAWALDNLEPIVYDEFLDLDPLNMDDIDRTIWRDRLRNGSSCYQLYGSEPLNASNADRRNEQFKLECLSNVVGLAGSQWDRLAEAAYERDNPTASAIGKARADHGDDFSIDWWGLQFAATKASSRDGCYGYFPQLFSGRLTTHASDA